MKKLFTSRTAARAYSKVHNGSVKDLGTGREERWEVNVPTEKVSAETPANVERANSKQTVTMFKLVTQENTTKNNTLWEIGVTNKAKQEGTKMCSGQVLHCYSDPRLAILFNPIHANIREPKLMEISCSPIVNTDGLKHACKEQTPVKFLELPTISLNQKVAFAIKCSMLVYKAAGFIAWAEKWLSGEDRTCAAARAAARLCAYAAADYAADAAACAAAEGTARAAARLCAYAAADAAADAAACAASNQITSKFVEIIDWVMLNIV
jgi:hypothetical protein